MRVKPMNRRMKLRSAKLGHRPGHAFPCPRSWSLRNPTKGRKHKGSK